MGFNGIEEVYCALYVDFDNIFTRLYELDPELAHEFGSNPKRWIRWIEGHAVKILYGEGVRRRILKRVCYLNPRRYQEYRSYFTMAAFQVVDCPPMTRQEKTSTDIHLVMDCLDALHHQTHFGEFIILSGDSDFTPLLLRLQEYARKTLVLSVGYTSPAYASAATWRIREDWFITQSLEKEEFSENEYDDYDMDNHYEMAAMREYGLGRDSHSRHSAEGELLQSHESERERGAERSYERGHDRKRYERNEREGYDHRKSYQREYQRPTYGSGGSAHSGYTSEAEQGGASDASRDEGSSYGHKKYPSSPYYQNDSQHFQSFNDEEESRVTVPVKVISYGKAKKTPEDHEALLGDTAQAAYDTVDAYDDADCTHDGDMPMCDDGSVCEDDGAMYEKSSAVYEDDVDDGLELTDASVECHAQGDADDSVEPENSQKWKNAENYTEPTTFASPDNDDNDDGAEADDDESLGDDSDEVPDTMREPVKPFQGFTPASAHGYASYASTLRQHGYTDDIVDEDDERDEDGNYHDGGYHAAGYNSETSDAHEINGNLAVPAKKPSISEQAATILKKVVMESAQPVPAANIGQILQRELGAGLDWFGFGKLRDFLDHLDLTPLEFSPVPPGYLYDPNRHERPEERGNNDEFRTKYPELFNFALSVHRLTDMPLLLPEHYKQILGYIVEEVNLNGFFMTTTSRNVRDRCIEEGLPIARSHVNFVIVGVGRGGCPLNDKQGISMRDVAKAFLRNAYDLCRTAQMELGEQERHQLMEWIMPKE